MNKYAKKGAAPAFIAATATSTSDECIPYPFCKEKSGYGRIRIKGRTIGAHYYMAEVVHGPRPSKSHEVCHSCGNASCVNPRHLYWGTRKDNVRDAVSHGTAFRFPKVTGEAHPQAKYSDEIISQVRERLGRGEPQLSISASMGISQSHVSRIKNGIRQTDDLPLRPTQQGAPV